MKLYLKWAIPVYTLSEANVSEHWRMRKKRHDIQKRWIISYFKDQARGGADIPLPCHIRLRRIGAQLLDSDNLPFSMKYIRDAIADNIFPGLAPGRADNDPRLEWSYDQRIMENKNELALGYGVEIEFWTE